MQKHFLIKLSITRSDLLPPPMKKFVKCKDRWSLILIFLLLLRFIENRKFYKFLVVLLQIIFPPFCNDNLCALELSIVPQTVRSAIMRQTWEDANREKKEKSLSPDVDVNVKSSGASDEWKGRKKEKSRNRHEKLIQFIKVKSLLANDNEKTKKKHKKKKWVKARERNCVITFYKEAFSVPFTTQREKKFPLWANSSVAHLTSRWTVQFGASASLSRFLYLDSKIKQKYFQRMCHLLRYENSRLIYLFVSS